MDWLEKKNQIKLDALKQVNHKYLKTFTINALTGSLYDKYDDEEAVKQALISMDYKHSGDLNAILKSNVYDDITMVPIKNKEYLLTKQGQKDLKQLNDLDWKEIKELARN